MNSICLFCGLLLIACCWSSPVEARGRNYRRNFEVGDQGVFIDYDYPQSPLSHISPIAPGDPHYHGFLPPHHPHHDYDYDDDDDDDEDGDDDDDDDDYEDSDGDEGEYHHILHHHNRHVLEQQNGLLNELDRRAHLNEILLKNRVANERLHQLNLDLNTHALADRIASFHNDNNQELAMKLAMLAGHHPYHETSHSQLDIGPNSAAPYLQPLAAFHHDQSHALAAKLAMLDHYHPFQAPLIHDHVNVGPGHSPPYLQSNFEVTPGYNLNEYGDVPGYRKQKIDEAANLHEHLHNSEIMMHAELHGPVHVDADEEAVENGEELGHPEEPDKPPHLHPPAVLGGMDFGGLDPVEIANKATYTLSPLAKQISDAATKTTAEHLAGKFSAMDDKLMNLVNRPNLFEGDPKAVMGIGRSHHHHHHTHDENPTSTQRKEELPSSPSLNDLSPQPSKPQNADQRTRVTNKNNEHPIKNTTMPRNANDVGLRKNSTHSELRNHLKPVNIDRTAELTKPISSKNSTKPEASLNTESKKSSTDSTKVFTGTTQSSKNSTNEDRIPITRNSNRNLSKRHKGFIAWNLVNANTRTITNSFNSEESSSMKNHSVNNTIHKKHIVDHTQNKRGEITPETFQGSMHTMENFIDALAAKPTQPRSKTQHSKKKNYIRVSKNHIKTLNRTERGQVKEHVQKPLHDLTIHVSFGEEDKTSLSNGSVSNLTTVSNEEKPSHDNPSGSVSEMLPHHQHASNNQTTTSLHKNDDKAHSSIDMRSKTTESSFRRTVPTQKQHEENIKEQPGQISNHLTQTTNNTLHSQQNKPTRKSPSHSDVLENHHLIKDSKNPITLDNNQDLNYNINGHKHSISLEIQRKYIAYKNMVKLLKGQSKSTSSIGPYGNDTNSFDSKSSELEARNSQKAINKITSNIKEKKTDSKSQEKSSEGRSVAHNTENVPLAIPIKKMPGNPVPTADNTKVSASFENHPTESQIHHAELVTQNNKNLIENKKIKEQSTKPSSKSLNNELAEATKNLLQSELIVSDNKETKRNSSHISAQKMSKKPSKNVHKDVKEPSPTIHVLAMERELKDLKGEIESRYSKYRKIRDKLMKDKKVFLFKPDDVDMTVLTELSEKQTLSDKTTDNDTVNKDIRVNKEFVSDRRTDKSSMVDIKKNTQTGLSQKKNLHGIVKTLRKDYKSTPTNSWHIQLQ
ncbi:probable serine/threonine-protein kinase nek3 [Clytia hemisphaerica]|uniref:Cnidarian restricted protein n=1 Tax=Clytia hemisphaerica TaxID=252671 RepID=A0A7M5WZ56_9CNID